MIATAYDYPFSSDELLAAAKEWNCNCGPSALAFALQVPLERVRHVIPGFAEKGYTSPTMMKAALANLGRQYTVAVDPDGYQLSDSQMFRPEIALVRIQICGPWTAPGANPRWAYRATHWIACWKREGMDANRVFDCNAGVQWYPAWEMETMPLIVSKTERANGKWFPTHVWRVAP